MDLQEVAAVARQQISDLFAAGAPEISGWRAFCTTIILWSGL